MKVYFLTNKTGSKVWRIIPQARMLNALGHETRIDEYGRDGYENGNISEENMAWADIIVTQMNFDRRILYMLEGTDKKIIYEIDDLQEVTHKKHYAYRDTVGMKGIVRRSHLYQFMSQVDAIVVTNQNLKNRYKWLTKVGREKSIYVLPNYVDMNYFASPNIKPLQNNTRQTRILWAGGHSHDIDLEYIKPVMDKVLRKYDNVKFVYMGHGGWSSEKSPIVETMYGRHVLKGLPREKMEFRQGYPWYDYPKALSMVQCDFGIAPLVDNKFARCKTPIKAMEYGIMGMPTIGQKFMYDQVIVDGQTGYAVEDQAEFYDRICELIEDPEKTKAMGQNAYAHIRKNFDLSDHLGKWRQVFEHVYNM